VGQVDWGDLLSAPVIALQIVLRLSRKDIGRLTDI
jgi:hypothetical protein